MKRYCKNVDITDYHFIKNAYYHFKKTCKHSTGRFKWFFNKNPSEVISETQKMLLNRDLNLPPIHYFYRTDPLSKKRRKIGDESPQQQLLDHICHLALQELVQKKVCYHQCASVKHKGQDHGKQYIQKWFRSSDSKYYVQLDIKKYYPSVDTDVLMSMLRRDVKNDTLLWLVEQLLNTYDGGMSIGSLLSQTLSNYYLSGAVRMMTELHKYRRGKKINFVTHVLTYADDWLIMGDSKRDLQKAVKQLDLYLDTELHLHIKPWKVCQVQKDPLDMVGFVFTPRHTKVRDTIFLRVRRAYRSARLRYYINNVCLAGRCVSYWGYFKRTDTMKFKEKIQGLFFICRRVLSTYQKERNHYGNQLLQCAA